MKGLKYSRKEGTIVWDSTETINQPASVIQIFDPESKQTQYFRFAANPDTKQTLEDAKKGKTPVWGQGKKAKVKLLISVLPLQGKDKEFKELPEANKNPKIVRISNSDWSIDPSTIVFKKIKTFTLEGRSYEDWKWYQVMDYLGESLYSLLDSSKEEDVTKKTSFSPEVIALLNLKQYLQVSFDTVDELYRLHSGRRLHMDVHWGNILLSKKNGQILVKLIDGHSTILYTDLEKFDTLRRRDLQGLAFQLDRCLQHFVRFNNPPGSILVPLQRHIDILKACDDWRKAQDPKYPRAAALMDTTRDLYKKALATIEQELEGILIRPDEGYLYSVVRDVPVVPGIAEGQRMLEESPAPVEDVWPESPILETQEGIEELPSGELSLAEGPAASAVHSDLAASTAALTSSSSSALFGLAPSKNPSETPSQILSSAATALGNL